MSSKQQASLGGALAGIACLALIAAGGWYWWRGTNQPSEAELNQATVAVQQGCGTYSHYFRDPERLPKLFIERRDKYMQSGVPPATAASLAAGDACADAADTWQRRGEALNKKYPRIDRGNKQYDRVLESAVDRRIDVYVAAQIPTEDAVAKAIDDVCGSGQCAP